MMDSDPYTGETAETLWGKRLAEFKNSERPEVVLLLAEDPELIRIAVAWTNTRTSSPRKFTPAPKADDSSDWWDWLWKNRQFSRQEIEEKTANTDLRFDRKFRALVGNRAIYPDGTVNSFIQRFLRDKVLRLFQTKGQRTNAKTQGSRGKSDG